MNYSKQTGYSLSGGIRRSFLALALLGTITAVISLITNLTNNDLTIPTHAAGLDDFVISVQTDNPGTSADDQFTVPTTGGGYDYNIDCDDDGTDEATAQTGNYTCDYSGLGGAGTYTVRIEDNSGG